MFSVITQALLLASVSGQFGVELPGMDFSGFIIPEILLEELSLGLQGITELWWVLSHN